MLLGFPKGFLSFLCTPVRIQRQERNLPVILASRDDEINGGSFVSKGERVKEHILKTVHRM